MKYKLTSDLVKKYRRYMSRKYDVRITAKGDKQIMHAIGYIQQVCGGPSHDKFMNDISIFLAPPVVCEPTCFMNFTPGTTKVPFHTQIRKIAHECYHRTQHAREPLEFQLDYMANVAERCHDECHAYTVDMELYHFFTGKYMSPTVVAEVLRMYKAKKRHIHDAKLHLISKDIVIRAGGIQNPVSKATVRWVAKNAERI